MSAICLKMTDFVGISVTLSNQNSSYTDSMIIENVLINSINYTERKMKILPVPYGMLEERHRA